MPHHFNSVDDILWNVKFSNRPAEVAGGWASPFLVRFIKVW